MSNRIVLLLVDLAVILTVARLLGSAARRIGQPPVIGELLAGILLGPVLFAGQVAEVLFPDDVRALLMPMGSIGLIMFMAMMGLELEHAVFRGRSRLAISVSLASTAVPFGLGVALAVYLSGHHHTDDRAAFLLFIGVAMAVTAFPVLARIIDDHGLRGRPIGALALACAAVDDVVAWSLLAVVVVVAGGADGSQALLLLGVPYLLFMLYVVRPLLRRVFAGPPGRAHLVLLVGVLLSAAVTEWIGLHLIFGAFLFGAIVPREGAQEIRSGLLLRMEGITTLLLPVYFTLAGLAVSFAGFGAAGVGDLVLILLVAVGGKFGGAFAAARLNQLPVRPAVALATLMNTRGLTEIVVLSVGLELGVIDRTMYSLMVVMAIVTTAMAGPMLRAILRKDADPDSAARSVIDDGLAVAPR